MDIDQIEEFVRSIHTIEGPEFAYAIESAFTLVLGRMRLLEAEVRYLRECDRFSRSGSFIDWRGQR